jgi:predicted lipid-binding transport protein (Tim44 family)
MQKSHMKDTAMRRLRLIVAIATLALAAAPAFEVTEAQARVGGGASQGSRGSRTSSAPAPTTTAPSTAQPMQRSVTPPSASAPTPGQTAQGGVNQGLSSRPSFVSGLMGGLIGAGIGGLLFGGSMFGGMSGIGGFLGFMLQAVLLFFVVRFLFGLFFNRKPALAGGPSLSGRSDMSVQSQRPPSGSAGTPPPPPPLPITPADFQSFERLLGAMQAAWSNHDLTAMRMIATPEMVAYFGEQMAEQTSRNVRNLVTDVRLEQGDLSEAWSEQGRDYATVAMRFSMIDVTRAADGRVVDGSPDQRTQATEIWTFLRVPGGNWVLSAIQQVT